VGDVAELQAQSAAKETETPGTSNGNQATDNNIGGWTTWDSPQENKHSFTLTLSILFEKNIIFKENKSKAWCKTIVTTIFYIKRYNSFAPSPRNAVLTCF